MNETDRKEKEQEELMRQYVGQLKGCSDSKLRDALVYFLTKDRTSGKNFSSEENNLTTKRKLFILKVLKESTFAGRFQIETIPTSVAQKLLASYKEEMAKEENQKQAHITELLEEMNEIF